MKNQLAPEKLRLNGRNVKAASRRLLEESKRQDAASTFCHSPALVAALPSITPEPRPWVVGMARRAVRLVGLGAADATENNGAPRRCAPTNETLVRRPWQAGMEAVRYLNVSLVGIRSRFSTRETIVSPDRTATSCNPKTAEEARKSRKSPRMGRTSNRRRRSSFSQVTFSHLPHFIRVHWRYSRAKSGSEFNESFCRSRSSRSISINHPMTASRSDAFDTPASCATGSCLDKVRRA
jgi:hypothetical protein